MASEWDKVAIPFVEGIDTKTDAKFVDATKLVRLENGIFTEHGTIKKRFGYDSTNLHDLSGNLLENLIGVYSRNDELLVQTDQELFSYDSNQDRWNSVGKIIPITIEEREVAQVEHEQTNAQFATAGGYEFYVWADDRGGVRGSVFTTDGTPIFTDFEFTSNTITTVRAAADNQFLYVSWHRASNTSIEVVAIQITDILGTYQTAPTAILSNTQAFYDIVSTFNKEKVLIVWIDTVAGIAAQLAQLSGTSIVDQVDALDVDYSSGTQICAIGTNQDFFAIAFSGSDGTNRLRINIGQWTGTLSLDTSDEWLVTAYPDTSSLNPLGVAPSVGSSGNIDSAFISFPNSTASFDESFITTSFNTKTSGTWGTEKTALVKNRAGGGSAPFALDNGEVGIMFHHESALSLQNSMFFYRYVEVDNKLELFGRASATDAIQKTGVAASEEPTRFDVVDNIAIGVVGFRRRISALFDNVFAHTGMRRVEIDSAPTSCQSFVADRSLYFNYGMMSHYDGVSNHELGFLLFPELDISLSGTTQSNVTQNALITDGVDVGTHSYRFYWEWVDGNGQLQRSAGISFSIEVVTVAKSLVFSVPPLTHTTKTSPLTEISLVGYRTTAGGTLLHRFTSADPSDDGLTENAYYFNDPTLNGSATISVTDDMDDATLVTKQLDYQNSGELDVLAPPVSSVQTSNSERVFLAGGALPESEIRYSKLRLPGFALEFNDSLTVKIDDKGGAITGLSTLGANLVVFKRNHIFVVGGPGQDNLGFGDFAPPIEVSSDVGCTNQCSIISTPNGVVFQSQKGIYLIDRGFKLQYIGAPVEGFNSEIIRSTDLIPDENQVYFLTESTTLCYDYFFDKWSTFTRHAGTSATIWQNQYTYLRDDGAVLIQNKQHLDAGQIYNLLFRTAPIRIEGIQGKFRARRVSVLGDYFSNHSLRMRVFRNRDILHVQEKIWDTDDFIDKTTYGDGATWGDPSTGTWGVDDPAKSRDYQVSARLRGQVVQSVSLEFQDIPGDDPGQSFQITELMIEFAPMDGLGRIGKARK